MLLSGDLLDSSRVYRETVDALAQTLGRTRCRVFIAPGNHDPYTAASPYALPIWPDNVHIFTSPRPEGISIPELNCTVYGAAFTDEQRQDDPLDGFFAQGEGIHLMVLHGNVQGRDYAPITPAHMAASGLDYLALGHIHQAGGLQKAGNTFWAYPGCPEGRGFDEVGDKGVLLAEVEPGRVTARFCPLAPHRYEILTIDLTGCADPLAAVEVNLPAHTQQDSYRILLTGEFNTDANTLAQLEQALAPRFYSLELQDRTRPPRDLWARAGEDTLTGLFLQTMATQCQADPNNEVLQLAVRFGLAALEQGEDVSP